MEYRHVDVFSKQPFSGNGLTVFMVNEPLRREVMQKITEEMRQFESIFLQETTEPNIFKANIFTMQEELDFAGHPILGAAGVLHQLLKPSEVNAEWGFQLNSKTVQTVSKHCGPWYEVNMEQGVPVFNTALDRKQSTLFLDALNLSVNDLTDNLPLQVVSTGLPYLLVPIKSNIEKSHIAHVNFENLLQTIGAKFAYIFDVNSNEGRTWDNEGITEDIATGSAAGPMGAYLVKHGIAQLDDSIIINQGSFLGRPSQITVKIGGVKDQMTSVQVSGAVSMVARGFLEAIGIA